MPLPFALLPSRRFPTASASTASGGGRRALGPETRLPLSESGGEFMGVEKILDLTKGCTARATDRVPNRDGDGERYQFLPPLRDHDPMVPRADHRPAQGPGTQAQDRS